MVEIRKTINNKLKTIKRDFQNLNIYLKAGVIEIISGAALTGGSIICNNELGTLIGVGTMLNGAFNIVIGLDPCLDLINSINSRPEGVEKNE